MTKTLVIVASNWVSFVASLKSNMKIGYCSMKSSEFVNGFYRAELEQCEDESYKARLKGILGEERENTLDLLAYLSNTVSKKTEIIVEVKKPRQRKKSYSINIGETK